jgi:RNA polymerase sigma-70 factor (ECF subfamily)
MPHSTTPTDAPRTDADLVQDFRGGSDRAAAALYQRYADRLRHTIERYCSRETASRFDAEDVMQSAFVMFYAGLKDQRYGVPEGGDLWNLLSVLAMNKLRDRLAYHRATKRSVFRTCDLNAESATPGLSSHEALVHLQLVIDEYLASLPECDREIVRLRMLGHSIPEIANQTGRAVRSIERLLQLTRDQLHTILSQNES